MMEIIREIIRLIGASTLLFLVIFLAPYQEVQGAALVEVQATTADLIPNEVLTKIKAIKNVTTVERYLWNRTKPYDVVGVEPGAPLRIVTANNRLILPKSEGGRTTFKDR